MLIEKAIETIERSAMLARGDRVLVAVSGGVDSVVLLDLLRRLAPQWDLMITMAHLDHGLRSKSREDAHFVECLGANLGLPVVLERADPGSLERYRALGSEAAAREVRRAFLNRVAGSVGAAKIALGHTASDRAETIIFRLTRGTGPEGLVGIRPVNGLYVRPLLDVTRKEILAYANERGLSWREDPSNDDLDFSRNRIRHRVLPELGRINPRLVEAICRSGDLVAELANVTAHLVRDVWPTIATEEAGERIRLSRDALTRQPAEVQSLLLREAFRRVRGNLNGIERRHLDVARSLIASDAARGHADLPRLSVRVQGHDVLVLRNVEEAVDPAKTTIPVELGRTPLPALGCTMELRLVERASLENPIDPDDPRVEVADADCMAFPLHVRTRALGDRFAPLGMPTSGKLKDFLINQHVPFYDRSRVPLLCDREKILWAVGLRLSDEVRVTETTRRLLIMRVEEGS